MPSFVAMRHAIVMACALLVVACTDAPEPDKVSDALEDELTDSPPVDMDARPDIADALQNVYADHAPLWFDGTEPSAAAGALLDTLRNAEAHGLTPADYRPDELAALRDGVVSEATASRLARADIRLSFALMDYAGDLHAGRIDPEKVDPEWYTALQRVAYAKELRAALDDGVKDVLAGLAPPHEGYRRLRKGLDTYRGYREDGGWPEIATGDTLEVGDQSPRVATLRRRLAVTGALDAETAEGADAQKYDETLADAVRTFQTRHGLKQDGKLGESTLQALNVPAAERVREIELNLERWRWLPQDLGNRHIVVNIPAFQLRAFAGGEQVKRMDVIVGKEYNDRDTPIFVDRMQYLVFRPYWNIPHGIAAEEILPKAREDEAYLADNDYQIVPTFAADAEPQEINAENMDKVAAGEWRLRQDAGPQNSLGLVKFLFPNDYAVYLHDTPADSLFDKVERDFSHGCIRVHHPTQLANWALDHQDDWDRERIDAAMSGGERRRVELESPIPVYLLYWTAFAGNGGAVQFREDLYGHDQRLDEALQEAG